MPYHATVEGTAAYERRFRERFARGHFRAALGLQLSSIGIGTYLGEADRDTDTKQVAHVEHNLATATASPLAADEFAKLFRENPK